jgi:hypothetical protein
MAYVAEILRHYGCLLSHDTFEKTGRRGEVRAIVHGFIDALVVYFGLLPFVTTRRVFTVAWVAVAGLLLFISAKQAADAIAGGIASPPMWDFLCFWLYGRVADVLHQPYDPHAMHTIAAALTYDHTFAREILDVGFIYPPPAILLFAPLGIFANPRAALPFWYALLLVVLCINIVLLWRRFLHADGWRGLLASALLVTLLPTTITVIAIGQTQFIAMAFLLLFISERSALRQGVWLAVATIIKPFLLVIFLYPLLRRAWGTLISGLLTFFIATLAALPLIGWHSIVSFIKDPTSKRLPDWMLTDISNQSILGWLVRSTHQQAHVTSAVHQPLYVFIVIALVVVTVWTIMRPNGRERDYCIALLVPLALLIYPGTGWHYTTMLLIPMFFLWSRREMMPHGAWIACAFTAVELALSDIENAQMFAFLAAWIVLLWCFPFLVAGREPAVVSKAFGQVH